jgi:CelD/BcsL family acetyltransferase involved in cellulose biosynthesis
MGSSSTTDAVVRNEVRELRAIETDASTDHRWDPFVKAHSLGSIFHHSLWLAALRREFDQKALCLCCEDEQRRLQGILPLIYTRGLPFGLSRLGRHATGQRLASLPRTPIAGPLSHSREASRVLVQEAARRAQSNGVMLQIKHRSAELDGLVDGVSAIPWRESYVLELPGKQTEYVRFGNAKHNHRITWAVNRAARLGIVIREADRLSDLESWYQLYLETMRRVTVLARSYGFFLGLWKDLRPNGLMRLVLAERRDAGRPECLAGSIFLQLGHTVHYAFTGCKNEALRLHVNDLIQWEAIQRANREGYRFYDFGEVAEERQGLADFKAKWCAKPTLLYRYHYPSGTERSAAGFDAMSLVKKCWSRMPLRWTVHVSHHIMQRL